MSRRRTLALTASLLAVSLLAAQDAGPRHGFSIKITEPEDQSIVFGKSRIAAEVQAASPALVDRVEFLVGDEVVFVDREPPYECNYDFGEASKAWVVRAVAHHKENVTVSDVITTRKMQFVTVESVNRVILWLSATNAEGAFVGDLKREDFVLHEDGRKQEILEFYREDRPLTVALLLDSSGSMLEKLKEVHAAASSFVDTLRPADRAMVIDFDDKVYMIQDLTADQAQLKEAIGSTAALGGTALYDALHAAYRKIGRIDGRKAIVLLTDGEDTFSQFAYQRVLEEAKSNNTLVYAIAIGGPGGADKHAPRSFSEATGGRFFYVEKASELGQAYARIAEELRTQYYLAYSTSNVTWDGRWIKLKVEHRDPSLNLQTRKGYFAVRQSMLGG